MILIICKDYNGGSMFILGKVYYSRETSHHNSWNIRDRTSGYWQGIFWNLSWHIIGCRRLRFIFIRFDKIIVWFTVDSELWTGWGLLQRRRIKQVTAYYSTALHYFPAVSCPWPQFNDNAHSVIVIMILPSQLCQQMLIESGTICGSVGKIQQSDRNIWTGDCLPEIESIEHYRMFALFQKCTNVQPFKGVSMVC